MEQRLQIQTCLTLMDVWSALDIKDRCHFKRSCSLLHWTSPVVSIGSIPISIVFSLLDDKCKIWYMFDCRDARDEDMPLCLRALNCYYRDWADYHFNQGLYAEHLNEVVHKGYRISYAEWGKGTGKCSVSERVVQRNWYLKGRFGSGE